MGFVAILGIVSLVGMVIRNSVILIDQIDTEIANGKPAWDAVIAATQHRLRPILLTAAAAILGMIPIAPTVFWGPMAYAVMGGLVVATLLTLVFLPALYVAWFRIQPVDLPMGRQENYPSSSGAASRSWCSSPLRGEARVACIEAISLPRSASDAMAAACVPLHKSALRNALIPSRPLQGVSIMKLNGKVALITGAASGIGHAIAKRYVEADGRVVIADLDPTKAAQAASELGDKKTAIGIRMDVSNEEEVNAGVDQAAAAFGSIDVLVSNAGIQIVHPIEEFPFADWKKMLAIHLDGAFLTTKACVKYMYKQNSGALIYMGSVHSHEASPLKSAYVAAKHGILGLARTMAKEGAKHNVRANVICPGFVMTPLVQKQIPEQAKELGITEERVVKEVMLGETVDKEFTMVEDIAEIALLLAGFKTNALTGESIIVSHGWHMN